MSSAAPAATRAKAKIIPSPPSWRESTLAPATRYTDPPPLEADRDMSPQTSSSDAKTRSARIKVRGVELAVRERGEGAPFVWGHGLLGGMDQEDEAELFRWSPPAACRWVRFDARGHGESGATFDEDDYRWTELARDMLGLVDALGAGRAVLGGVSMGCATSLHAAVAAPERVAGLVLVAPPTAWETRPRQSRIYRVSANLVEWLGVTPFRLLGSLPQPRGVESAAAALQRAHMRHLSDAEPRAVVAALRGASRSDLPDPDALRALPVPTLVLAWRDDPFHPLFTAMRLVERMPDVRVQVAADLRDMQSWPQRVAEFLEEVAATRPQREA